MLAQLETRAQAQLHFTRQRQCNEQSLCSIVATRPILSFAWLDLSRANKYKSFSARTRNRLNLVE